MSKRSVYKLEGLVEAVFDDIKPTYTKAREWERDRNRSLHELGARGSSMLTKLLPAIRKHFDKCLDEGLYTSAGLYLQGRVKSGGALPVFMRDLLLQIFDTDGKLRNQPSSNAVADFRQVCDILNKLETVCESRYVHDEVETFIKNEGELRSPTLQWVSDRLFEGDHDSRRCSFTDGIYHSGEIRQLDLFSDEVKSNDITVNESLLLQRVCDHVVSQFGDLHTEESTELPKHGPGRVSDLKVRESKFSFPCWPNKLDLVFPFDRYAIPNSNGMGIGVDNDVTWKDFEHPSKLIAVPKTATGPRLIASEPSYHQWIQQLIRNQLENRITRTALRYSISFGDQTPNNEMALASSVDGFYATVDLKSASDRLSCWTVERALRANITMLERIHASRTRTMVNAIDRQFDRIILKKCFTQGNACTFPVQTIVYAMVAVAAVLASQKRNVSTRSIVAAAKLVRVFGDDIIVPNFSLEMLTRYLSFLQLRVNSSKTFSKGRFRESCGVDAFDGVDVTPARIRSLSSHPSHEDAQSMLESANNLFMAGMWNTSEWMLSHLRAYQLPIEKTRDFQWDSKRSKPYKAPTGRSIMCFSGDDYRHLKVRWNARLHREEHSFHRLVSKSTKNPTESAYDLSEFLFRRDIPSSPLDYLNPQLRGLGVVDKVASVMRRGWNQLSDSASTANQII